MEIKSKIANTKIKVLKVQDIQITILTSGKNDYMCITDIAKIKDGDSRAADVIKNWIRSRTTLEFIGTWEQMYNPDFKVVEFDHFKMQAGLPSFVLSPGHWVEKTNAIGIYVKQGKYGGTFAHKDIAFEFCSAVSPVFKLYFYATEADILNVALFGKTAFQWRLQNPEKDGNIRDHATLEQLVVLSNLESINSVLIHNGLSQSERLIQLNETAIIQLKSLMGNKQINKLK